MKRNNIIALIICIATSSNIYCQYLTNLKMEFVGKFDNTKSFYISPIPDDEVQAVDKLKYSLYKNGIKDTKEISDADYVISFSYKHRQDNKCRRVIKEMTGTIMDVKKTNSVVVNFKFYQTSWETNCTDAIFNDFSDRLVGYKTTSNNNIVQKTNLTMQDVYSDKELVFYGFDFSNFRFIDAKYLGKGKEIRDNYFASWNSFPLTEIPVTKMQKWFDKDKITYNPVTVTILNSKVDADKVVQTNTYVLSKELISETISKYDKPTNSNVKIGYVVNVEYFDKESGITSAYVTFFEIATGGIISCEKISNKEAAGKGLTAYWGKSLSFILKDFYDKKYKK